MQEVKLDLSKDLGLRLKPFHGMCNGPLYAAGTKSVAEEYKELGVPYVRLHDTYGAYSRLAVDVSKIFPNFDADETDENNYYFQHTDQLLLAIKECGADIIYRLGESIDHSIFARSAVKPKDYEKWTRICMQIIKHYNAGWANGFKMNITYWEIWNEPEGVNTLGRRTQFRGGTLEEAFALYGVIAKAIKAYDPNLKVGGMSFINCNQAMEEFLLYCAENKLPLDFVSSHGYGRSTTRMRDRYDYFKNLMVEKGYGDAEWLLAEWCFYDDLQRKEGEPIQMPCATKEQSKRLYEEYLQKMPGASFSAYLMSFLQDSPFTQMHFYDAEVGVNMNVVFDDFGLPRKGFYAFKAYGEMYRADRKICELINFPEPEYRSLIFLATPDYALITNYSKTGKELRVKVENASGKSAFAGILTDDDHTYEEVVSGAIKDGAGEFTLEMKPFSFLLLKLN